MPMPTPWRLRPLYGFLIIEDAQGLEVCRFYSVSPIDRANAEWVVQLANSWSNADALRTRIVALAQLHSTTDSIDSPQPEVL